VGDLLHDPVFYRGWERIVVVMGAILLTYLGYRLFLFGFHHGRGRLEGKSKLYELTFSGTGPGLFFMILGALILLVSLATGGARMSRDKDGLKRGDTQIQVDYLVEIK